MSHQSSIIDSLREIPTSNAIRAEHLISLIDAEAAPQNLETIESQHEGDDTNNRSDPAAATASQPSSPGPSLLAKRINTNSSQVRQSLKRKLTERKYAKYTQERYDVDSESGVPPPPDEDPARQPQHGEPANAAQKSYLERSTAKAKAIWSRKKGIGRGKDTEDMVTEVLYENQRGTFFFGVPKYSSSSLLPSDPKPWQNAQFRTSPVDIRNAQVPDPSWEWAWKSWYVDMSRDVDEEGWEYSLKFTGNSSWHGNHPWFHSFVRRRRWLRVRKRRKTHRRTKEKSHELTADYFTIHPKTLRPTSEDMSRLATSEMAMLRLKVDEEPAIADLEITDIAQLMRVLRKASVDREKLVAVRKFAVEGGEELYYLAERIPDIMSLLVFQSSRRQLLADLIQHQGETHERSESLQQHVHDDDEDVQKEHETATRHATNLMSAIEAADAQVKKLEYWSDIKGMAREGDTMHSPNEDSKNGWDTNKWAGLTSPTGAHKDAFMSKQKASAGTPRLHKHAEHGLKTEKNEEESQESSSGVESERSKMWDRLFPKKKEPLPKKDSSSNKEDVKSQTSVPTASASSKRSFEAPPLERFMTAPEDVSEIDPNDPGTSITRTKASASIDGAEDGPDPSPNINLTISQTLDGENDLPPPPRTRSVQIVEPVSFEDGDNDADEGVAGGSKPS